MFYLMFKRNFVSFLKEFLSVCGCFFLSSSLGVMIGNYLRIGHWQLFLYAFSLFLYSFFNSAFSLMVLFYCFISYIDLFNIQIYFSQKGYGVHFYYLINLFIPFVFWFYLSVSGATGYMP